MLIIFQNTDYNTGNIYLPTFGLFISFSTFPALSIKYAII